MALWCTIDYTRYTQVLDLPSVAPRQGMTVTRAEGSLQRTFEPISLERVATKVRGPWSCGTEVLRGSAVPPRP